MDMTVKLQVFEGPLDLLLHLIDKNKVNIYDIPIVEITNQYLDYIKEMKKRDLNILSEFLVMAATLIDIKSKMLLPVDPEKEEEEAKTDTSKTASEAATEPEEENKVGIVADLDDFIYLDGKKIELGCNTVEMPDPFGSPFKGLSMPLNRNYYIRTGIGNEEEFFIINAKGGANGYADGLQVKGVITENRSYDNWGIDNSGFHTFEYQGMSQDSTIDDVLELFGQPREVLCTSSGRFCFTWLHYETEEGDYLHVRVDPMLNEVVEVRVSKYFENEKYYD